MNFIDMTLEVDNVELYFKNKAILNGIYLKAETGQVTGLLGSNGCGKSCLFNIIFGHLKPKYKLIRIDAQPKLQPLFKNQLAAYLPQHHLAPTNMKVKTAFKLFQLEYLLFSEHFQMDASLENARFKTLSGGERRLIELYLILKSNAEIVLLDEPFTHLSPLHIASARRLIKEESQSKVIVVTDHMYREVIAISDRLYLLKNGSTLQIKDKKALEDYNYLSTGTSY